MTASERLRALAEGYDTDINDALYNALPLIADVVEAAEGIEGELPIDQGCHDMLYCVEFRAALASLREHLEGQ